MPRAVETSKLGADFVSADIRQDQIEEHQVRPMLRDNHQPRLPGVLHSNFVARPLQMASQVSRQRLLIFHNEDSSVARCRLPCFAVGDRLALRTAPALPKGGGASARACPG